MEALLSLDQVLVSDKDSFELRSMDSMFSELKRQPRNLEIFQNLMQAATERNQESIADAINLNGVNRLLEVGGGNGKLCIELAKKHPDKVFAIYELEECTEIAKKLIDINHLTESIKTISGNFFESVADGFDGIVMKHVMHDWSDEKCALILKNCRRALNNGDKFFIIDLILAKDGPSNNLESVTDIQMMMAHGGKERNRKSLKVY